MIEHLRLVGFRRYTGATLALGGRSMKLKGLRELPEALLGALRDVADGLMR